MCSECDYVFYRRDNLTKHIKAVHLKVKTFKWSECSNDFYGKVDLKRHIKSVHLKEKLFKCT